MKPEYTDYDLLVQLFQCCADMVELNGQRLSRLSLQKLYKPSYFLPLVAHLFIRLAGLQPAADFSWKAQV